MTRSTRSIQLVLGIAAAAALAGCHVPGAAAGGAPDSGASTTVVSGASMTPPVSSMVARQQLAELQIAVRATMDGYDRDKKFPHWKTVSGACNVREEVLKRDGTDVVVAANCAPKSGTWRSVYDDATWTSPSDVDIDHVVPLGQSWVSGAKSWPQDKREQFANDLVRPQLKAVTDNLNQQKSDKAPDQWKPPLVAYWCTYASDWITVKRHYELTITVPEQKALSAMLDTCAGARR